MSEENVKDFRELLESLRGDVKLVRAELEHLRTLNEQRLRSIEKVCENHETRLRDVTAGVTQFRFWSSVTSGGSTAMSILALLKTFIGN